MSTKTPPVSVGRSKRKIIIESQNFLDDSTLPTSPQDQFRKDYDLLWKDGTLEKGSYGISPSNPADVQHPIWRRGFDKFINISFKHYNVPNAARLMRGEVIFEDEKNALSKKTQVYSLLLPHWEMDITDYDPLSSDYDPRVIRYVLPRGPHGPALASIVYGANASFYRYAVVDGGQHALHDSLEGSSLVSPTKEEFVYDVLNGLDPGPVTFDTNSHFVDSLVTMDAPYNVKGATELDTNDAVFFDIKSSFQYNQSEYIKAITRTVSRHSGDLMASYSEIILPNFYQVVSDYVQEDARFKGSVTMGSSMSDSLTSFYRENGAVQKTKKPYMLKHREYFATYASVLPDVLFGRPIKVAGQETTIPIERLMGKYLGRSKNIAITTRNWDYLTDHSRYIEEFPIYNELSFRSEVNSGLSELFSDVYMDEPLIKTIISCHEQADKDQTSVLSTDLDYAPRELFPSGVDFFSTKQYMVGSLGQEMQTQRVLLNEFDFMSWLEAFKQGSGMNSAQLRREGLDIIKKSLLDGNASFIGEEDQDLSDSSRSKFLRTFMNLIGQSRIISLVDKNQRDFFDILRGKPCFSETIFYKICKHVVEEDGRIISKPIQKFWISNNPNTELVKFYDTQVKFDARYKYIVYAYKLIIGSKYRYLSSQRTDLSQVDNDIYGRKYSPSITSFDMDNGSQSNPYGVDMHETNVAVQVELEPTIKIVEVPYYGTDPDDAAIVRTYDDPPLPPNIEIVPYVGVDNMFLLNLNSAIGRHEDHVKIIEPSDSVLFEKVREYQEKGEEDKVIFSNDDNPRFFEIYRIEPNPVTGITQKPKNYAEFSGHLHQTIEGPHVSVKQFVKPNKKYYYTFRSIDDRGNVSNPGPVYEVEMVGNELMFPIIKEYTFPKKFEGAPIRHARRFLYVKPNYDQVEVDTIKSGFTDTATKGSPILGTVPEEPLFSSEGDKSKNKIFKIRLTSKKSGKKIDFNVRFKHEHENFK